jgi:hypothetical protein
MSPRRTKPGPDGPHLDDISSFLNVDLHIRSRTSLEPLLNEWTHLARVPDAKPPHKARWVLVNLRRQPKNAEAAIRALVRLVKNLSTAGRRAWRSASSRTFDIGIQAGIRPYSFEDVRLAEETLQSVARVHGNILVTVYAPRDDTPEGGRAASTGRPTKR